MKTDRKAKARLIWHMNEIARAFNDEDLLDSWLVWGIETEEDAADMVDSYREIERSFARHIRLATGGGAEGLGGWTFPAPEEEESVGEALAEAEHLAMLHGYDAETCRANAQECGGF